MMLTLLAAAALTPASDYKLVWSDEFDKPGKPDPTKWTFEEGVPYNNEKEFYTSRPENGRVENGRLVLEARKDNWNGHEITSARLVTAGKASWLYGRFEARLKVPKGKGTWPAFWMLGDNIRKAGWPKCGEIDIMENVGFDPDRIHGNVHTEAYNHVKRTNKGANLVADQPWEKFHVYAVEWLPDRIDFFLDDKKYFSFAKESGNEDVWPFDKPQYIILNLAVGGTWGGAQGIDDSIFPSRYEIDYVRVYQRK